MIIAPIEPAALPEDVDAAQLLIKEARRRARRRRLSHAIAAAVVLVLALVLITTILRSSTTPTTGTRSAEERQIGAAASLPRTSRIWTLDMMNQVSGFAVAGVSSARRDEMLIETTNAGRTWSVLGTLPYSFVAGQFKPLLDFVTPTIGYTQAFREGTKWVPDNIYVTTDAGKSWSKLRITGEVPSDVDSLANASTSPDFRVSNGAVSLVSLHCGADQVTGACPATLSEYRWGATTPFSSHRVLYLGVGSKGRPATAYLLAAPSSRTALLAEGTGGGPYSLVLTTDSGAAWSLVPDPCNLHSPGGGIYMSGISLTASRWMLNCSQGTGMNHDSVLLSETNNEGRAWSTINYTAAWGATNGAIAGEIDQVWTSNGANVLWSYSSLGFTQVSRNGGRTWSLIRVNGKVLNSSIFGGWPIEFDPVGSSEAYFVTRSGQILLTRNGTNFTPVHLLHQTREQR